MLILAAVRALIARNQGWRRGIHNPCWLVALVQRSFRPAGRLWGLDQDVTHLSGADRVCLRIRLKRSQTDFIGGEGRREAGPTLPVDFRFAIEATEWGMV